MRKGVSIINRVENIQKSEKQMIAETVSAATCEAAARLEYSLEEYIEHYRKIDPQYADILVRSMQGEWKSRMTRELAEGLLVHAMAMIQTGNPAGLRLDDPQRCVDLVEAIRMAVEPMLEADGMELVAMGNTYIFRKKTAV